MSVSYLSVLPSHCYKPEQAPLYPVISNLLAVTKTEYTTIPPDKAVVFFDQKIKVYNIKVLGPVVQSIVSLTSSFVVKMLTVPVRTISNSQVFLLKNVSSFANAKATHIFSAKILAYIPYFTTKVLKVRQLTTPLALNNWALTFFLRGWVNK